MSGITQVNGTGGRPAPSLTPYLEQARRVSPLDHDPLRALEPGDAGDQSNRVLFAHVVRIVGAEQHMSGSVLVDHVAQHLRIKTDGIEIHFPEVARRGFPDHGPAIWSRAVRVVHTRPVMR